MVLAGFEPYIIGNDRALSSKASSELGRRREQRKAEDTVNIASKA